MTTNKKILIGLVIVAVVVGVGYVLLNLNHTNSNPASSSPSGATTSNKPAAATITYTNDGFTPATVTVKAGDTVAIKNDSSEGMQLDSDPHPVHTDDPELNVGAVSPGQSMSFKVTVSGTHGYHNHLNPSRRGTIIVQ